MASAVSSTAVPTTVAASPVALPAEVTIPPIAFPRSLKKPMTHDSPKNWIDPDLLSRLTVLVVSWGQHAERRPSQQFLGKQALISKINHHRDLCDHNLDRAQ